MTPKEDDEVIREDGVKMARCTHDDPLLAPLAGEKIKLSAFFKDQLDAAIRDAAKEGWRVHLRSHCSETGRHGAKLYRPLDAVRSQRQAS